MRSFHHGAQRASFASRLSVVLAATMLASLFTFGASAAAPAHASAMSAPWSSVEAYYLRLLNCTRTGGWVEKDGSCTGYGSGKYSPYRVPFKLSAGLSTVSRLWSNRLAVYNRCEHGDPGARLRARGYKSYRWGENIGCGSGYTSVYQAVLASHLHFQAEKSSNGGHWKNIKNAGFGYVGVGIWKDHGRTRLVIDFYSP